jgi:hypothetical protein
MCNYRELSDEVGDRHMLAGSVSAWIQKNWEEYACGKWKSSDSAGMGLTTRSLLNCEHDNNLEVVDQDFGYKYSGELKTDEVYKTGIDRIIRRIAIAEADNESKPINNEKTNQIYYEEYRSTLNKENREKFISFYFEKYSIEPEIFLIGKTLEEYNRSFEYYDKLLNESKNVDKEIYQDEYSNSDKQESESNNTTTERRFKFIETAHAAFQFSTGSQQNMEAYKKHSREIFRRSDLYEKYPRCFLSVDTATGSCGKERPVACCK